MSEQTSPVSYEFSDGIAGIVVDNPPVNALSHPVRQGLINSLMQAAADRAEVILLACAGRSFIAGADIREIGQAPKDPQLPEVIQALDESEIPVVAIMHGHALGGGLEIALACNYRIAAPTTQFGLPEVNLGIIPGAGGTQRLPRLIGVSAALQLISTGKSISAEKAMELGIVDTLLADSQTDTASQWYRDNIEPLSTHPRLSQVSIEATEADISALAQARIKAERKPAALAPRYLCDAIEASYTLPFSEGLATERTLFRECRDNPQSAAFRHLFFAERAAGKLESYDGGPAIALETAGVVGGGTMGRGIAISLLDAGLPVTLMEISEEAKDNTGKALRAHYESAAKRGRMTDEEKLNRISQLNLVTSYSELSHCDMVIEAVFEDLKLKQGVFQELDQACKPEAILASNTSFQDINLIAAATGRPERVLGMHYFSPANIMKLLEVVQGSDTSAQVMASAISLGRRCGKIPVISGVCYGFIGNRINRRLQQQAQHCLLEGATPAEVDGAMEDFGMAMGPLAVGDLAGLDIGYTARQALSAEEKGDPKTYWIPDQLVERGRLGQKSGAGYYSYEPSTRERKPDDSVLSLIEEGAEFFGCQRANFSREDIVERLLLAVVNEAAKVLEENIAARAGDIDLVSVNGYGFPAYRGGIMHWAEHMGIARIHDKLSHYWETRGDETMRPAALITHKMEIGENYW